MTKLWTLFAIGVPLIAVACIVRAIRTERKRKEELRTVAERLGLSFADKNDAALAPLRRTTGLFQRGYARRFSNILHGRIDDLSAYVFDYAYSINMGDSRSSATHKQTVAAIFGEQSRAPKFELRPEHLGHRLKSFFGFEDIDIPDHPVFSKKFHLTGPAASAVRDVFTADVADRLVRADKVCIESTGQWIVIYRPDKRLKPHEIEGFLQEAFELTTLFM